MLRAAYESVYLRDRFLYHPRTFIWRFTFSRADITPQGKRFGMSNSTSHRAIRKAFLKAPHSTRRAIVLDGMLFLTAVDILGRCRAFLRRHKLLVPVLWNPQREKP